MASRLTLHPTAAAAARAMASATGPALVRGDSERGFFAFALELARRRRPFRLPEPAERLALALASADQARMDLPVSASEGLAGALSDLHGAGLSSPQLRRLQAPGLDRALEGHRKLLTEHGLCDPSAVPWLAAEAAGELAEIPFDEVWVAPRIEWSQGELALLEALAKRCPVTVQLPEDRDRPELFEPLDPVHQELARAGNLTLESCAAGFALPGVAVEALSHATVGDEGRATALRVRSLLRAGVAPDSIAVTALGAPAPELYSALEAAGVPVGAPDLRLLDCLPGQSALAILATVEEGIPRERVCELIEARLLDVPRRWARHLREAGSGGHGERRLFPPLEALLRRKPEISSEGLESLAAAVEKLTKLPPRARLSGHARELWRALEQLGMVRRLGRSQAGRTRAPVRQLQLFGPPAAEVRTFDAPWVEVANAEGLAAQDELRGVLNALAAFDSGRELTLAEFARFLKDAFARTPVRGVPAFSGGVLVASAGDLWGRRFRHVFLTGLSGPGATATESVHLPESLRRAARELCGQPALLPGAGPRAGRQHQRMQLALAAGLASERLVASGSRTEDGKPLEPSPLLAELGRWAAGGLAIQPLRAWPVAGKGALSRDEVCAALPDEPLVAAAEPARVALHRNLRFQRRARERALIEGRIDAYAGDLGAPDLAQELRTRLAFDAARPLSASALDRLAGCGFRAFADLVLRLKPGDELDEDLDPRRRGTVLHRCLEKGFLALKNAGLLPLGEPSRAAAQRDLFLAAVRGELAAVEEAGEASHPVIWAADRRGFERLLLGVLDQSQHAEDGFVPAEFEAVFGRDRPLVALTVEGGDIQLGGRLDRVDLGPEGSLRIVDYKSGGLSQKSRRLRQEFARRELQLGHYSLLFKLSRPEAEVDAVYYSIRDAEFSPTLSEVCKRQGLDLQSFVDASPQARARARELETPNLPNLIDDHVRRARAGHFAIAPGDCKFCEFAAACRVDGYYEEWE